MRILVVEDEKTLNELIVKKMKSEHYSVDACFDGKTALTYCDGAEYDVIILDIMLPNLNGLEVLKYIRNKQKKCTVLLLTAKDNLEDKVAGLNAGADDYLIKPFAFEELLARIRALIRRNSDIKTSSLQVADLILNLNNHTAMRCDKEITLSSKEFAILEYMLIHKDNILSREKLYQHIWNYDYDGASNMIDVYIRYLRKKIDDGHAIKLIHTIRGVGYVLKSME